MINKTNFLNKILILVLLFSLNCVGNVDESILNQEIQSRNREECDPNNPSPDTLAKIRGKRIQGPRFKILCPNANIDEIPPEVTATPGEGRYGQSQSITLAATEEAAIYYSTDGTEPNANSAQYVDPITIDATATLKFYAVDLAGNASAIKTMLYEIDGSVPNVFVALVSSPAVSGDTSTGSSPAVQIHWQSNMEGSYRVESAGLGVKGSGLYLLGGDLEADTGMVTTIPGSDLEVGDNRIYIYVTNKIGVTGHTSVDIVREDDPPSPQADLAGGLYGSAQDVTIFVDNEAFGVRYIYYTTDGTEPTIAPDEADANGDGTSDICTEYPFRPSAGMRCRIANSSYTNPIHLEPHLPANCTPSVDCNERVTLKFFAQDVAGNVSGVSSVDYDIDMINPSINISGLSSVSVRREGSISFQFTSSEDGIYQVALNPGTGNEAVWDSGNISGNGAVKAGASYNMNILGENFPGPSGTPSVAAVRVRDESGRVGTASITITRDDVSPVVSLSLTGGTYGYDQVKADYSSVTNLNATDNVGGAITVYYTDDGSIPSTASGSVPAGGSFYLLSQSSPDEQNNVDCLANPLCDGAKIKNITLKYFAKDGAGNESPVETENFTILPTGGSVAITYPQNDVIVPKDGSTTVKFFNNLSETMEYVISHQWGASCYNNTDNPDSPFEAGEAIDQDIISAGDYKWTFVYEKLFPIEPYNASVYPVVSTSAIGTTDELVVNDAGQFSEGDFITYDYNAVRANGLNKVAKVTEVIPGIDSDKVRFTPALEANSEEGKALKLWITTITTTGPGGADTITVADSSIVSVGDKIIYDFRSGGLNQEVTVEAIPNVTTIQFDPALGAGTSSGINVKIIGNVISRRLCVYSRINGDTGAWAVTSKNVYSDFDAPEVSPVDSIDNWITTQNVAKGGYETAVIRFRISGSASSGDTTVPAKYYVRIVNNANQSNEYATDFIGSGVINAVGQTVYATVPVDALAAGSTDFRIYVEDPFGNVGKSIHSTLYRNDNPTPYTSTGSPRFMMTGVSCTNISNCTFTMQGEGSGKFCDTLNNCVSVGPGAWSQSSLSVPLKEDIGTANGTGDISGGYTSLSSAVFSVVNGSMGSETIYFPFSRLSIKFSTQADCRSIMEANDCGPSHSHSITTFFWTDDCCTDGLLERHHGNSKLIGGYSITGTSVSSSSNLSINWAGAVIKSHSYTGSKVFSFTNEYGLKSSLLVDCSGRPANAGQNGGCIANPF